MPWNKRNFRICLYGKLQLLSVFVIMETSVLISISMLCFLPQKAISNRNFVVIWKCQWIREGEIYQQSGLSEAWTNWNNQSQTKLLWLVLFCFISPCFVLFYKPNVFVLNNFTQLLQIAVLVHHMKHNTLTYNLTKRDQNVQFNNKWFLKQHWVTFFLQNLGLNYIEFPHSLND